MGEGIGTYLGQQAKNKKLGKIPRGNNKTTKIGDVSRKKARNDTDLLLHPPEKEDDKWLPDLLAFKYCTAYMGNLKTMFMDKFREKKPPIVFHRDHWSRILSAIFGMKTIYCTKHNIGIVNPKQRSGQRIYLFLLLYKCIELHYCYGGFMHLIVIVI